MVGWQCVHVDGVAPLVPTEETLPERRQRQRASREKHEGHFGHAAERVPAHPRRERRAPEQLLVRHRVLYARWGPRPPLQPLGLLLRGGAAQARPEQRWRDRRHRVPRHVHADGGQAHAQQQEPQEHLEHPRGQHPPLPRRLPRLLHVLHGRHTGLHRGARDSWLQPRVSGIYQI